MPMRLHNLKSIHTGDKIFVMSKRLMLAPKLCSDKLILLIVHSESMADFFPNKVFQGLSRNKHTEKPHLTSQLPLKLFLLLPSQWHVSTSSVSITGKKNISILFLVIDS